MKKVTVLLLMAVCSNASDLDVKCLNAGYVKKARQTKQHKKVRKTQPKVEPKAPDEIRLVYVIEKDKTRKNRFLFTLTNKMVGFNTTQTTTAGSGGTAAQADIESKNGLVPGFQYIRDFGTVSGSVSVDFQRSVGVGLGVNF